MMTASMRLFPIARRQFLRLWGGMLLQPDANIEKLSSYTVGQGKCTCRE